MTISVSDGKILKRAFFTDDEISDIANAVDPSGKPQPPVDINSPLWRGVILSRKSWHMRLVRRKWTGDRIRDEINRYYAKRKKGSVYDFLKAEYMPKKIVDFQAAWKRKKAKRAAKYGYQKLNFGVRG